MRITVPAYAKINLHLQILGPRADGYHDVVTVLQSLALHDTLTCEARPGLFELRCDRAGVPLDASNLVWRAARLIAEQAGLGEPAGACVTIEKRIPMQAGLGGGSADAAAALVAFARLWEVPIEGVALVGLARRLGADVPFCLAGGTALGRGRGDELTPLPDLPERAVLILMPPFGVSTPDAYRWHDERVGAAVPGEALQAWPSSSAGWDAVLPACFNDFETVVGRRFPEVPAAVAALRRAGARLAAMSGSGAALFGLFDEAGQAEAARGAVLEAVEAVEDGDGGWQSYVTSTRTGP